jgi:hypothetical protein
MKKEIVKQRVIKYTFMHQKAACGADRIGEEQFACPDGDGMELVGIMKKLPMGHKITTIIIMEEEA